MFASFMLKNRYTLSIFQTVDSKLGYIKTFLFLLIDIWKYFVVEYFQNIFLYTVIDNCKSNIHIDVMFQCIVHKF